MDCFEVFNWTGVDILVCFMYMCSWLNCFVSIHCIVICATGCNATSLDCHQSHLKDRSKPALRRSR